jgi:hypothetical protein
MSESYWSSRSSSAESDSNVVHHPPASGCYAEATGIADSVPESRGSPFGVRCHNFSHHSGLAGHPRASSLNG